MTINIDYDRKEKQYTWLDEATGEIVSAPPGRAERAKLWKTAVKLTYPELYAAAERIIIKHPQLERVTWKAVDLVINESVEVFPGMRAGVLGMVDSSDGFGRYAVTYENGYQVCQCAHFQQMEAPITDQGNRYCKHLIAVYLWQVTQEERF